MFTSMISFITLAATLLAAMVAPAQPDEEPSTPDDQAHFRLVWDEYGVSPATQDILLSKWARGEIWDSLTGGLPTSVDTKVSEEKVETVSTFADGSISISGISVGPSSDPLNDFAYNVVFRQVLGGYDNIVAKSGLTYNCYAGTCDGAYVNINRTTETSTLPAQVQGGLTYHCISSACTRTYFLVFELANDAYSAWNN